MPASLAGSEKVWLPKLLVALGLASSNSDARRLVESGGVRVDGTPVTDPDAEYPPPALLGRLIQVGRRRFVRIAPVAPPGSGDGSG